MGEKDRSGIQLRYGYTQQQRPSRNNNGLSKGVVLKEQAKDALARTIMLSGAASDRFRP